MKTRIKFAIYLLLNLMSFGFGCESPPVMSFEHGGLKFEVPLTQENMEKMTWDGRSELPVKISDVLAKAAKAISSAKNGIKNPKLCSIELSNIDDNTDYWYYRAVFVDSDAIRGPRSGAGTPQVVVILLDGTVIEPIAKVSAPRAEQ